MTILYLIKKNYLIGSRPGIRNLIF